MRHVVTVHCIGWEVIISVVAGVLERRIKGCAVGGMRELLAKTHDDLFRIVAKDIVARLDWRKLGKSVADVLVLGLLGIGRMDTCRRTSGPRATTTSRHCGFGT